LPCLDHSTYPCLVCLKAFGSREKITEHYVEAHNYEELQTIGLNRNTLKTAVTSPQHIALKSVPDRWLALITQAGALEQLTEGMELSQGWMEPVTLVYSQPYLEDLGGLEMAQVLAGTLNKVADLGGQFSDYRVKEIVRNSTDDTVCIGLRLHLRSGRITPLRYTLQRQNLYSATHTFRRMAAVVDAM